MDLYYLPNDIVYKSLQAVASYEYCQLIAVYWLSGIMYFLL